MVVAMGRLRFNEHSNYYIIYVGYKAMCTAGVISVSQWHNYCTSIQQLALYDDSLYVFAVNDCLVLQKFIKV